MITKQELILQISDNKFTSVSLTNLSLITFLTKLEDQYKKINCSTTIIYPKLIRVPYGSVGSGSSIVVAWI